MKLSPNKKFVLRKGPRGFGYGIFKKDEQGYSRILIFHTSNKEQALKEFEGIEERTEDFPTSETNWMPRLLKIKTKHHNYNYVIRNPKELDEVAYRFVERDYTAGKYSSFQKWDMPEEYNGVIEESVINSCPDADARKLMRDKNRNNKSQLEDYKKHNNIIDAVGKHIENKNIEAGYKMLNSSEFLYYELELADFDND